VTIYTIGHSTRSFDDFLALVRAHGIAQVADIRKVPRSRRHPHFSGDALAPALARHGLDYRHFPELGGFRRPHRDSPNVGWVNESFRGYADYMQTGDFDTGLARLLDYAAGAAADSGSEAPPGARTAVMCAEAVWWRCHRALLADALVVRGVTVCHILSIEPAQPHQLCAFAQAKGTIITYVGDNRLPSSVNGNRKRR
jgi:uncharacterized protein (DUF488 family)